MDLIQQIKQGNTEKIREALSLDPAIATQCDSSGVSALMISVYYQKTEITSLLRKALPSLTFLESCSMGIVEEAEKHLATDPTLLDSESVDGFSGLGYAAFFGQTEVAKFLIRHGAKVDRESNNPLHVTPLGSAVAGDHLAIAQLLLEHHADPNHAQNDGFTPLHSACQNGNLEMIGLLRNYGADPSRRTTGGKTPADLCEGVDRTVLIKALER